MQLISQPRLMTSYGQIRSPTSSWGVLSHLSELQSNGEQALHHGGDASSRQLAPFAERCVQAVVDKAHARYRSPILPAPAAAGDWSQQLGQTAVERSHERRVVGL